MTKEEKYLVLLNNLASTSCPEPKLNVLKEHFREKIDSDRRYDRIASLMSLITILEKRDVISQSNINSVRYIAEVLQDDGLIYLVSNFNATSQPARARQNIIQAGFPRENDDNINRVLPRIDLDPTRRVYDLICTDIGQKWKDFARALKVPEGFIDELEYKHRNKISEMVREIITYHRDQCDPRYWQCELRRGLVDARRRDLSHSVDIIFAMHGSG